MSIVHITAENYEAQVEKAAGKILLDDYTFRFFSIKKVLVHTKVGNQKFQ